LEEIGHPGSWNDAKGQGVSARIDQATDERLLDPLSRGACVSPKYNPEWILVSVTPGGKVACQRLAELDECLLIERELARYPSNSIGAK